MTLNQVKKLIDKELGDDNEENESHNYNFYDTIAYADTDEIATANGAKIKVIEQIGEAHDGATLKTIIKIDDKFYAVPIYYSSWDSSEIGTEYTEEVEQVEVTTKKWMAVKKKKANK